jgi:hypothetical protein
MERVIIKATGRKQVQSSLNDYSVLEGEFPDLFSQENSKRETSISSFDRIRVRENYKYFLR